MIVSLWFVSVEPGRWLSAPGADRAPAEYQLSLRADGDELVEIAGAAQRPPTRLLYRATDQGWSDDGAPCGDLRLVREREGESLQFAARVRMHPAMLREWEPASHPVELRLDVDGLEPLPSGHAATWRWDQDRRPALPVRSMMLRAVDVNDPDFRSVRGRLQRHPPRAP